MFKTSINMKGLKSIVKSGKPMKMHQFFEIINPPYVTIRIKPHTGSKNANTKDFGILAAELYKKDTERLHFQKWKVTYTTPECLTYEIEFINGEIQFLISCPKDIAPIVIRKCNSVWKDSHVDIDDGYIENWNPQNTVVYELLYGKQDALSLGTDARDNMPLESMFYAIRGMQPTDHAKMYCHVEPRSRGKWMLHYSDVMERLKNGTMMPQKSYNSSMKETIGWWMSKIFSSIMLGMSDFITDGSENIYRKQMDESNAGRFQIDNLTPATKEKASSPILRTHLWVLSESENAVAAQNTAQIIAGSFKDLTENNELMAFEVRGKRKTQVIKEASTKGIPESTRFNLMSHKEVGKIFQVPGLELQTLFPEAVGVKSRELTLPDKLFDDSGIPLGIVMVKGKPKMAYMPTDNKDILCRPHMVFGQQGCGKTLGFGANTALEMIKRGYSVFYMDFADGNAIDCIRDALPEDYPDYKCLDLDWGNTHYPIPCDVSDVASRAFSLNPEEVDELDALEMGDNITDFIINFVNTMNADGESFSQRMENLTSAAGRATLVNPNNGLMDMIMVLRNSETRKKFMEQIKDSQPDVYDTLKSLEDSNRIQESIPSVMDRLIVLFKKGSLSRIFLQPPKIDENGRPLLDYRHIQDNTDGGYGWFVGIRIPSAVLKKEATAYIASFQFSKIWLACKTRCIDIPDKDDRHPFALIVDEPHVFAKYCASIFEEASVEARKYRCKLIWLMHTPSQFNTGSRIREGQDTLSKVIAGGCNISAYFTKNTRDYETFALQMDPYEPSEIHKELAIQGEAINDIDITMGHRIGAFKAIMLNEPGKPKHPFITFKKDRSYRREECSKQFGRWWKEVNDMIVQKRRVMDAEEMAPQESVPRRRTGGFGRM